MLYIRKIKDKAFIEFHQQLFRRKYFYRYYLTDINYDTLKFLTMISLIPIYDVDFIFILYYYFKYFKEINLLLKNYCQ